MPQNQAVEEYFGESEIRRDVVWIQIVQGNDDGAGECANPYGRRICDVDDVCPQLLGDGRKAAVVPDIAAKCSGRERDGMEMKPGIGSANRLANVLVLPWGHKNV